MSIGSFLVVPPVRFGRVYRSSLGIPSPTDLSSGGQFVCVNQRQGVEIPQAPVALGLNLHQGVEVPQPATEAGERTLTSNGIIVGAPTATPEGESITQVWSG